MRHRENAGQPPVAVASAASLRMVMACFPTGVTVVATRDAQGKPIGLTVNSFTSVALDPPLVLVCISHSSASYGPLLAPGGFAVSVLAGHQAEIARRFSRQPSEGRFDGVEWWEAPGGNPVIAGATAWVECTIESRMEAGDHTIIVARASSCGSSDVPALVYDRGTMRPISP